MSEDRLAASLTNIHLLIAILRRREHGVDDSSVEYEGVESIVLLLESSDEGGDGRKLVQVYQQELGGETRFTLDH
jgi:hypothetical protein